MSTAGEEQVWVEVDRALLGISPEAQVTYSHGKLFRISASGSLLELGVVKALAEEGKIKRHATTAPGRVQVPAAAFR
jgi:hypothetical protein